MFNNFGDFEFLRCKSIKAIEDSNFANVNSPQKFLPCQNNL